MHGGELDHSAEYYQTVRMHLPDMQATVMRRVRNAAEVGEELSDEGAVQSCWLSYSAMRRRKISPTSTKPPTLKACKCPFAQRFQL